MRNIALILMYNGSAYHGWQVQKTEITVAETLERGLSMVCGEKIKVSDATHQSDNVPTTTPLPLLQIKIIFSSSISPSFIFGFPKIYYYSSSKR